MVWAKKSYFIVDHVLQELRDRGFGKGVGEEAEEGPAGSKGPYTAGRYHNETHQEIHSCWG